jgi:hypothetical protein
VVVVHPATRKAHTIKLPRRTTGAAVTVAVFTKARLRLTRANPKFDKGHREGSCQYGDRGLHIAALTAKMLVVKKRSATRCGSDESTPPSSPNKKGARRTECLTASSASPSRRSHFVAAVCQSQSVRP